ncbi:MAG: hypothetical protein AAB932_01410 [Patescibacteria group bacterium]
MIALLEKLIITIGIPSIILGMLYIGRKLQILDDMSRMTEKIKHNVKLIADSLINSDGVQFDHTKLQAYSPLRLTDEGMSFVRQLEFDKTFGEHQKDFFDFIDTEQPKVAYDVELAAKKSVLFLFDREYFFPVKSYLFQNPAKERMPEITNILGVYVRDKYLALHPEFVTKEETRLPV